MSAPTSSNEGPIRTARVSDEFELQDDPVIVSFSGGSRDDDSRMPPRRTALSSTEEFASSRRDLFSSADSANAATSDPVVQSPIHRQIRASLRDQERQERHDRGIQTLLNNRRYNPQREGGHRGLLSSNVDAANNPNYHINGFRGGSGGSFGLQQHTPRPTERQRRLPAESRLENDDHHYTNPAMLSERELRRRLNLSPPAAGNRTNPETVWAEHRRRHDTADYYVTNPPLSYFDVAGRPTPTFLSAAAASSALPAAAESEVERGLREAAQRRHLASLRGVRERFMAAPNRELRLPSPPPLQQQQPEQSVFVMEGMGELLRRREVEAMTTTRGAAAGGDLETETAAAATLARPFHQRRHPRAVVPPVNPDNPYATLRRTAEEELGSLEADFSARAESKLKDLLKKKEKKKAKERELRELERKGSLVLEKARIAKDEVKRLSDSITESIKTYQTLTSEHTTQRKVGREECRRLRNLHLEEREKSTAAVTAAGGKQSAAAPKAAVGGEAAVAAAVGRGGSIVPDDFDCILCYDPMTGVILQCVYGHCVCAACYEKLGKCAVCRTNLAHPGIRNRFMENVIAKYFTPVSSDKNATSSAVDCEDALNTVTAETTTSTISTPSQEQETEMES